MHMYLKVRQAYNIDGKTIRGIAREFDLNRRTVYKMLKYSTPPGYVRQNKAARPKLDSFLEWIDEVLEDDKKVHRKQRHTAVRIFNRLKDEQGYTGSYSTVRYYVANKLQKSKEMYVPLEHEPGSAQFDFGEADVIIAGKQLRAHYAVMQLPYSDTVFCKIYEAENTESFCDGHKSAFEFFGGVPNKILYDNSSIAVKKILEGGTREQTDGFIALKSHYLFTERFANVASGNEKGGVENLVGYVRRNFMVPIPHMDSFEELNIHLADSCLKRMVEIKRGHKETVGQRFEREVFLPLANTPYECCRINSGKVNSLGLVRFCNNDYSVPTHIGRQKVWVKGYFDRVVIIFEHNIIADHRRSYSKEEVIFNPLHYLKLLERKAGAFEQAAPLKRWDLPPVFEQVKNILFHKDKKEGLRSYIRILQLLEVYSIEELQKTLEQAVAISLVDEMAIRHLLKRQIEKKPTNLSMIDHPRVPHVTIKLPDLGVYSKLCTVGAA